MLSTATLDASYPQHWLQPDWRLPGVHAYFTTRYGAFSEPPYDGFNCADHVGDDNARVAAARVELKRLFRWPNDPQWLEQVHGTRLVQAKANGAVQQADAVYTHDRNVVCTLHTADCLPIFIASRTTPLVALVHAGWRGLSANIIEQTLQQLPVEAKELMVWIGPAISQDAFEVGSEVRAKFVNDCADLQTFFESNSRGRWQCDLAGIAHWKLLKLGCSSISVARVCTFQDPRFFSYRRTPVTGRMLSLIWLDPGQ